MWPKCVVVALREYRLLLCQRDICRNTKKMIGIGLYSGRRYITKIVYKVARAEISAAIRWTMTGGEVAERQATGPFIPSVTPARARRPGALGIPSARRRRPFGDHQVPEAPPLRPRTARRWCSPAGLHRSRYSAGRAHPTFCLVACCLKL